MPRDQKLAPVRVSLEEKEAIARLAARAGVGVSEWVRSRALERAVGSDSGDAVVAGPVGVVGGHAQGPEPSPRVSGIQRFGCPRCGGGWTCGSAKVRCPTCRGAVVPV